MAVVRWSATFETGVPALDDDHRELFRLLNDLHENYVAGTGEGAVGSTLASLQHYVDVHFAREEAYMLAQAYPELEIHRARHIRLAERVGAFVAAYQANPAAVDCAELVDFLKDWLNHHILLLDMDYVAFAAGKLAAVDSR